MRLQLRVPLRYVPLFRPLLTKLLVVPFAFSLGCRSAPSFTEGGEILTLAQGYMGVHEPAVAEALFLEKLHMWPRDGRAALGLGWAALGLGDYQKAALHLKHAAEGDGLTRYDAVSLKVLLGRAYAHMGQYREAWQNLWWAWRHGEKAVRDCIHRDLKALARKVPPHTEGLQEILAFRPPPPRPVPPKAPPPPEPSASDSSLVIIARSQWHPMHVRRNRLVPMGRPFRITIHHSADDNGYGRVSRAASARLIQKIQKYHMQGRGWGDIAYHFIIDQEGRIWEGRSLRYQGAHAGNFEANKGNVGIVVEGNFQTHRPDNKQIASLKKLIRHLRAKYRIAAWQVYGHNHFRKTACPGRYLSRLIPTLR